MKASSSTFDFSALRELRKRQGMTIVDVSERCGISPTVISKLERNQSGAELDTLFRLSRAFGMNAADLIALAESRAAHRKGSTEYTSDGFGFQRVSYGNMRCMYATAKAGAKLSSPEIHQDDYEMCWVLTGRIVVGLPNERYELGAGEAVQFDAILVHTYEALEDSTLIIVHLTKEKRF
jgi:transcriptional regulator with XRE-family HTH domain